MMESDHLNRPELLRLFAHSRSARVILVRAAAGFGKTTLLRQYEARATAEQRAVHWFSLSARDDDSNRFLSNLQKALHPGTRASAEPEHESAPSTTALNVADIFEQTTQPFTVVLDELDAIQDPAVLSCVQQMVENIPAHGLLLLACRRLPNLNLGRLRARGELLEIGHGLLRFSKHELADYLHNVQGLNVGDDTIRILHERTEGWPVAIYLASLSLRDSYDVAAAVANFAGTNIQLAQFLAEDVVARLDVRLQDFLLKTSVVDQFCEALCEQALGIEHPSDYIQMLERDALLFYRSDHEPGWFRYHRLFLDFLRARLNRQQPEDAGKLARACAAWYFQNDQPIQAVEQTLSTGTLAEAIDMMAKCAPQLRARGRTRVLCRWFDRVPAQAVAQRPDLAMALAWALMFNRRGAEARELMDKTLAEATDTARPNLKLECDTIRCVMLAMSGNVAQAYEQGAALQERLDVAWDYQRGALANARSFACLTLGRHHEARQVLTHIPDELTRSSARIMLPIRVVVESLIDLAHGRLLDAEARLTAQRHASGHALPREAALDGKPTLDILRALTYYEQGRLQEAARLLTPALVQTRSYVSDDSLITSHILGVRLAWAEGDRSACLRLLAELEQLGRSSSSPRVVCSAWLERARLAIMQNQLDTADDALRAARLTANWDRDNVVFPANEVETPLVGYARLTLARGAVNDLDQQLGEASAMARAAGRHRRVLTLDLLRAMALLMAGRPHDARSLYAQVLQFAGREGYVRFLPDEGPAAQKLHHMFWPSLADEVKIDHHVLALLDHDRADASMHAADSTVVAKPRHEGEALSARELQVMKLLAEGLRNKAIADRLCLSEFTVKSHLRNIHAKLGATARTEAVAIARARGLLE